MTAMMSAFFLRTTLWASLPANSSSIFFDSSQLASYLSRNHHETMRDSSSCGSLMHRPSEQHGLDADHCNDWVLPTQHCPSGQQCFTVDRYTSKIGVSSITYDGAGVSWQGLQTHRWRSQTSQGCGTGALFFFTHLSATVSQGSTILANNE